MGKTRHLKSIENIKLRIKLHKKMIQIQEIVIIKTILPFHRGLIHTQNEYSLLYKLIYHAIKSTTKTSR